MPFAIFHYKSVIKLLSLSFYIIDCKIVNMMIFFSVTYGEFTA